MAENIVHLVLARVTGAPEGVKGISLFVVPKFLVNADGSLGARNDVHCVSIEHKLGIKASPTAVLQFGDHGGAVGLPRRPGEPRPRVHVHHDERGALRGRRAGHRDGRARLPEGRGLSRRTACRAARSTARCQAARPSSTTPTCKRMLMTMRAYTEGCRAMALVAAAAYDAAHHHPDAEVRKQNQAFYEFMVPLVKGYSTEMSLEVTTLGVQVHGGMGFIEETGAAQYYRDAKILTIYEGTTAIQANDLVGRKTARDGGQHGQGDRHADRAHRGRSWRSAAAPPRKPMPKRLRAAREAFLEVVDFVAGNTKASPNAVFAGRVPYLMLAGNLMAGWQLARALMVAEDQLAAGRGDAAFMQAKITTARFYADHILSKAPGLRDASSKAPRASPRWRSTRSESSRRP